MDKILHEYDQRGRHRLVVNDDPGYWFVYDAIATWPKFTGEEISVPKYYGVSEYHGGIFPSVFSVTAVEHRGKSPESEVLAKNPEVQNARFQRG